MNIDDDVMASYVMLIVTRSRVYRFKPPELYLPVPSGALPASQHPQLVLAPLWGATPTGRQLGYRPHQVLIDLVMVG